MAELGGYLWGCLPSRGWCTSSVGLWNASSGLRELDLDMWPMLLLLLFLLLPLPLSLSLSAELSREKKNIANTWINSLKMKQIWQERKKRTHKHKSTANVQRENLEKISLHTIFTPAYRYPTHAVKLSTSTMFKKNFLSVLNITLKIWIKMIFLSLRAQRGFRPNINKKTKKKHLRVT